MVHVMSVLNKENTESLGEAFEPFRLMPVKHGTCGQCSVKHNPKQPHDARSLFYQYWFYGENGRWPNWKDAMSHCDESVKKSWVTHLKMKGVDVLTGGI